MANWPPTLKAELRKRYFAETSTVLKSLQWGAPWRELPGQLPHEPGWPILTTALTDKLGM